MKNSTKRVAFCLFLCLAFVFVGTFGTTVATVSTDCDPDGYYEFECYSRSGSWIWNSYSCSCDCDGAAQSGCLEQGKEWDYSTCTCVSYTPWDPDPPSHCGPQRQQDCQNTGGAWNDNDCKCTYGDSNPLTPQPPPPCSASQKTMCEQNGGTWVANSTTCYCDYPG
jgi:hypothetical protein